MLAERPGPVSNDDYNQMGIYGRDSGCVQINGAAVSAPKLAAFLAAIKPDGTVTVHVDSSGKVTPVRFVPATARVGTAFSTRARNTVRFLLYGMFVRPREADLKYPFCRNLVEVDALTPRQLRSRL